MNTELLNAELITVAENHRRLGEILSKMADSELIKDSVLQVQINHLQQAITHYRDQIRALSEALEAAGSRTHPKRPKLWLVKR